MLTPLMTLLRESLESAVAYSAKLKSGLEGIAGMLEEGDAPQALARFSDALQGIGWLIAVYDDCREFVAAPRRPEEEAALRAGLLEALRGVVAQAEAGDADGTAWRIRNELLPRVEMLGSRVEALSRLRASQQ